MFVIICFYFQRSVAVLLEEMDGVLKGQKEVSTVAEKSQWWEGRKALDVRVEVRDTIFDSSKKMIHVKGWMLDTECNVFVLQKMLEEMEEALGVWRTLLLPLTSDPELEVQVKCFQKALKGTKITEDILKVCGISWHLHQFDHHMFPPSQYFFLPEGGSLSISTPVPARAAVPCGGDGSAGQGLPEASAGWCG